jgi:hypothetical protein
MPFPDSLWRIRPAITVTAEVGDELTVAMVLVLRRKLRGLSNDVAPATTNRASTLNDH